MKQGKPLITFVIVLLAAALACYLAYYVWGTFQDPFTTTYAYEYELNDSVEAEGLIIRSERVLSGGAGIVDVTRGEGEQVGAGQTVALVYRDGQAQQAQEQQDALALEITQLRYAIGQSGSVSSVAEIDQEIFQSLVALRGASALHDYASLEEQVLEIKGSVLRREYSYGADLTAEDLATRLNDLTAQYSALQGQTYNAVTQISAPQAGTFSTLVDGYELLVSLDTAPQLTPAGLEDLLRQTPTGDASAAGKLILSKEWYFAALVTQEEGERLETQSAVTLRFAGGFTQDIPMEVVQVSPAEEGRCVVLLSTDRFLEQTTLLRRQSAELIFNSHTGLRVPKAALRIQTDTQTDQETGETTEINTTGVYTVMAGRLEFKPVSILAEGSDFYVVRPAQEGSRALRSGDELVVQGTGLYSGKLVELS